MTPLELRVPGDKSIAHRALILGALARGESRVSNLPDGGDVASTLAMMRALGADIEREGARVRIRGAGARVLRAAGTEVDCGNSGTSARLGMGLAAALDGTVTFTGDESLRRRPMERVAAPLRAMGALVDYLVTDDVLPLRVRGGPLRPLRHESEVASAQVKSAVLLAGLASGTEVAVRERAPSRDHTERLLRAMGADLRTTEGVVELRSGATLAPLALSIPGDVSSAAFLIAAALLAGTELIVRDVGVNPTRTGFLDVLARMGATVERLDERDASGEPVADLRVRPAALRGTRVAGADVVRAIDELPLVAVLAAHADGETVVADAAELRAKESDRIRAVCANLEALGVDVDERPDGFAVRGVDAPLAGHARAFGDHRIAMAFDVLGLRPGSRIRVDDPGVARVSYPAFGDHLERVRAAPLAPAREGT